MATRKSPPKKRKPPAKRKPAPRELRMPHLDDHQLDIVGLGLVALAAFFAPVFYLGWDGGKVGEALAEAFRFLFGGVSYLVPIAFFATGTLIVLRTLLPSVRPFRAGAVCLLTALMLGLAGTLFAIGPGARPAEGFFDPDYFRGHGGTIGEALYYVTSTLFSRFGSYLIFVFLLVAGVMLLTGPRSPGSSTRPARA
jgi:DNA segregation ATPase FtsK/SpoIIIE, S-DNA-T family